MSIADTGPHGSNDTILRDLVLMSPNVIRAPTQERKPRIKFFLADCITRCRFRKRCKGAEA